MERGSSPIVSHRQLVFQLRCDTTTMAAVPPPQRERSKSLSPLVATPDLSISLSRAPSPSESSDRASLFGEPTPSDSTLPMDSKGEPEGPPLPGNIHLDIENSSSDDSDLEALFEDDDDDEPISERPPQAQRSEVSPPTGLTLPSGRQPCGREAVSTSLNDPHAMSTVTSHTQNVRASPASSSVSSSLALPEPSGPQPTGLSLASPLAQTLPEAAVAPASSRIPFNLHSQPPAKRIRTRSRQERAEHDSPAASRVSSPTRPLWNSTRTAVSLPQPRFEPQARPILALSGSSRLKRKRAVRSVTRESTSGEESAGSEERISTDALSPVRSNSVVSECIDLTDDMGHEADPVSTQPAQPHRAHEETSSSSSALLTASRPSQNAIHLPETTSTAGPSESVLRPRPSAQASEPPRPTSGTSTSAQKRKRGTVRAVRPATSVAANAPEVEMSQTATAPFTLSASASYNASPSGGVSGSTGSILPGVSTSSIEHLPQTAAIRGTTNTSNTSRLSDAVNVTLNRAPPESSTCVAPEANSNIQFRGQDVPQLISQGTGSSTQGTTSSVANDLESLLALLGPSTGDVNGNSLAGVSSEVPPSGEEQYCFTSAAVSGIGASLAETMTSGLEAQAVLSPTPIASAPVCGSNAAPLTTTASSSLATCPPSIPWPFPPSTSTHVSQPTPCPTSSAPELSSDAIVFPLPMPPSISEHGRNADSSDRGKQLKEARKIQYQTRAAILSELKEPCIGPPAKVGSSANASLRRELLRQGEELHKKHTDLRQNLLQLTYEQRMLKTARQLIDQRLAELQARVRKKPRASQPKQRQSSNRTSEASTPVPSYDYYASLNDAEFATLLGLPPASSTQGQTTEVGTGDAIAPNQSSLSIPDAPASAGPNGASSQGRADDEERIGFDLSSFLDQVIPGVSAVGEADLPAGAEIDWAF